ncbi:Candidapepsin-like protein [Cladobotryum mycophilum]|uniref:Candidapepsin-like protein n=1 Tax=Cladobotryum mycophilum TaxID=491253 RepID=A0ABR0SHA3_9HYPO
MHLISSRSALLPWFLIPSLAAAALPVGVIEIPLQRIKNQSAYGVEIMLGNPPQKVITSADTGSPTYGFESPINTVCQQGLCSAYGTYNNLTSSTAEWLSGDYSNFLIDHGFGSFMNDTLRIGGVTLENMNFGVVEKNYASFPITGQQTAIFGLGAMCSTKACDTYPTVLQQLYEHGAISRRAFSVYLGPNNQNATGTILIGGIDRAKRQGPVFKRKVWDPTNPQANMQPNFINIIGMELQLSNGVNTPYTYPNETYALMDTGTPGWYMPQKMYGLVAQYFGIQNPNPNNDLVVDCKYRTPTKDSLAVDFGDGAKIAVPLHRIVTQLENGNCIVPIAPYGQLLGDPFLRGLYFTFDYDELTVEFAAVKYTDDCDIVKIE